MNVVLRLMMMVLVCMPVTAGAAQLTGDDAWKYIGDLGRKLTGSTYSLIELNRRNRDPRTAGFLDAMVFVPHAASYRSIRSLDDNHVLVIGAAGSGLLQARPVDRALIDYCRAMILENRLKPIVMLDNRGAEAGIVFCGIHPCAVVFRRKADASLYLEVRKTLPDPDPAGIETRLVPDRSGVIR